MTRDIHDTCRVCGGESAFIFKLRVRTYPVAYFDCPHCGYLQTERPYWLKEAYASPINDVDTGIMMRNILNVRRVVMTLVTFRKLAGRVIDHAGGFGILVRLLRDIGVDARWRDEYCENLLARGFEADEAPADLVTAFEVFEHLVDPKEELRVLLTQSPVVLLSTELILNSAPPSPDWWYLGPEHGQHIGFFRTRTLAWMARALSCNFETDGRSTHLFARVPIPQRWTTLQRLGRATPLIARFALRSRTMSDFEQLRRPRL